LSNDVEGSAVNKTKPEQPAPPRVRTPNVERAAQTQNELLQATVDCLHRHGYGATTTQKVAAMAGLSRGAMNHHYPSKAHLMAEVTTYAYNKQCDYREAELAKLDEGMPRFMRLLDLAWETAQSPYAAAVNEIRIASRSDGQLQAVITPLTMEIAAHYGRFLGRHVKAAGLESDAEMRGATQTWAMALRALASDLATHPDPQFVESVLSSLRAMRDAVVARQLARKTDANP